MPESTHTHELPPDGNAAAQCRVVGLALMVVGVCWIFRFLPYFILLFFLVPLYVPWESNHYTFTEFAIKSAILIAGAVIVAGSYFLFKSRCYWIALLAPIICLLLLGFCYLALCHRYRYSPDEYIWHKKIDYLDYFDRDYWYTHPWYHLMEGMIPTEQVISIASCFADYTPRYYMDERHHPKVEIPVNITLFFLAPTTLIGLFGLYTLLTPDVRRSFSVPLTQRVKMSVANEKTQLAWRQGLSRSYAVLMFLLLLALLPTPIMDFIKPGRHEYLMPPVNVFLNYAIGGCMMIGITSYFTRRYYAFALFAPLAWIVSAAYFRWQIAQEYEWFISHTHNPFDPAAWTFCSMLLIVLVSRLTFGGLGIWIWWKNWKHPAATGNDP